MTAGQLLAQLSKDAETITAAIDKRQASLERGASKAERELFLRLLDEILSKLDFTNGLVDNSVNNLLLLYRLDRSFEAWQKDIMNPLTREFVLDLLAVGEMTGIYYEGYAAEKIIQDIATSNELLYAALGVKEDGTIIKGSIMADISSLNPVRQEAKMMVLQGIQSGQTLKELTKTLKDFVTGKAGEHGAINKYFNSRASGYAYDLFNKVAEIKNEQFREALDLKWLIYVGSPLKDSRQFCLKKKGKVFAVVEADVEWPDDPDLIAKKSGIPYTPRIDRGRMNCTDRIRYITRELAVQLDPDKVKQIEASYELLNVE